MHFSEPLPRFLDRKKVHKLSRKLGNRKENSASQGISTSKKPLSNETPEVHEFAHALAIFYALSIVDRMTKKYLHHVEDSRIKLLLQSSTLACLNLNNDFLRHRSE